MSQGEELRWVRRREGTHRPASRATPGYERDLLSQNDGQGLLGPTESRPADIDEIIMSRRSALPNSLTGSQKFSNQLGDAILDALRPHIDRGVDVAVDAAMVGITRMWKWVRSKSESSEFAATAGPSSPPVAAAPAGGSQGAITDDEATGLAVPVPSLTPAQYQAMFLSALLADQYAARLRQVLAGVLVVDEALPAELEGAVSAALKGPAPVVDEATLAKVVALLDNDRAGNGSFKLVSGMGTLGVPRESDLEA